MLPTPRFHHLHLNSVDPDEAIGFYTRQFPSTSAGRWGGIAALRSPNDVMILFDRVDAPPATTPPSAIWHFGWHVPDVRGNIEAFKARPDVSLCPLYTGDGDDFVLINSDSWPAPKGAAPGLTRAQIEAANQQHIASIDSWYLPTVGNAVNLTVTQTSGSGVSKAMYFPDESRNTSG